MKFLQNFWVRFCLNGFKTSFIASHLHYNYIFMHYRCMLYLLQCCVLVGLDSAEPMMYLCLHVTCSCIFMHTYFQVSIFLYIYCVIGAFLIVFLSPSISLFCVSYFMAPKRKSTLSQNPLWSGASSSFDSNPSSIRFRDEKTHKDFLEKFSRRGIHLEHRVILSDFSNIDLSIVIHSRGCESLYGVSVTCPSVIIQEFYSNIHGFDSSAP